MTLSQRLLRKIRRYELPLGLFTICILMGTVITFLSGSVVFGVAMFLTGMLLFGVRYGLPALGRWIIEHSGILESSGRVDSLYQWVLSNHDFVGTVLISAVFTIFGAGIAVVETGTDRLHGIAVVLIFGSGCLFILASKYLSRATYAESTQQDTKTVNRTVCLHDQSYRALVFEPPTIGIEIWLAILTLVSWISGVILLSLTMLELIVWIMLICGILMGLLILAGVFKLLRSRSIIALLEIGLLIRGSYGFVFIPWDAIEDVEIFELGSLVRKPCLGVTVTDRSMIEWSWLSRLLNRANRSITGYDIVPEMTVEPQTDQIEMTVRHFLDHPSERSQLVQLTDIEEIS